MNFHGVAVLVIVVKAVYATGMCYNSSVFCIKMSLVCLYLRMAKLFSRMPDDL